MKKFIVLFIFIVFAAVVHAAQILIPMDDTQKNHLKAYGVAYYVLENNVDVQWLLNYRGGSFIIPDIPTSRRN
jgi:hypothetical protein